jgi:hypothetical protein
MARGRRTAVYGPCERFIKSRGEECKTPGRYVVYGSKTLCRRCYQIFMSRPGAVLFVAPRPPTVAERWAFHLRLREGLDV